MLSDTAWAYLAATAVEAAVSERVGALLSYPADAVRTLLERTACQATDIASAAFVAALAGERDRLEILGRSAWPRKERRWFVRELLKHARKSRKVAQLAHALRLVDASFDGIPPTVLGDVLKAENLNRGTADLIVAVGALGVRRDSNPKRERAAVAKAARIVAAETEAGFAERLWWLLMFDVARSEIVARSLASLPNGVATLDEQLLGEAVVVSATAGLLARRGDVAALEGLHHAALPITERREMGMARTHAHIRAWQDADTDADERAVAYQLQHTLGAVDPSFDGLRPQVVLKELLDVSEKPGGSGNEGPFKMLANLSWDCEALGIHISGDFNADTTTFAQELRVASGAIRTRASRQAHPCA